MNWSQHDNVWDVSVCVSRPGTAVLDRKHYDVLAPSSELAEFVGRRLFKHFEPDSSGVVALVFAVETVDFGGQAL